VYNTRFFAGVAQSVEQLICNQPVAGSIPIASSKNIKALGANLRPFLLPNVFGCHLYKSRFGIFVGTSWKPTTFPLSKLSKSN
jgi:hypothetical protein